MEKIIDLKKSPNSFSRSTFDALIYFHFIKDNLVDKDPTNLDSTYKDACQVEFHEFEFILACLVKHLYIFQNNLGFNGFTIANLCKYGLDAYLGKNNSMSKSRQSITNLFKQALVNSNI